MTVDIFTLRRITYFDAQDSSECQSYNDISTFDDRQCVQTNFSATYQVEVADGFNFTTGSQIVATGDLATDIIQIGDIQIANARFGVARDNIFEAGSIGLGYGLNDGIAAHSPYRSFLEELEAAGAINSKLYSLSLNNPGGLRYPSQPLLA